jgi:periplasmic copper chaperone A
MNLKWIPAAAAVAGLMAMQVASAHIVLAVREAPAGSYLKAVFQVPHGCEGVATTAIQIDLPAGIVIAKPASKSGWTLTIQREPLVHPVTNEGHQLTERVKSIRWEGGSLPDAEFEEFTVLVRLPADVGRISFPVVQVCGSSQVAWVQEPAPDASSKAPPHPAPSLLLTRPGNGL